MRSNLRLVQLLVRLLRLNDALSNARTGVLGDQLGLGEPLTSSELPVAATGAKLLCQTGFTPVPFALNPLLVEDAKLLSA